MCVYKICSIPIELMVFFTMAEYYTSEGEVINITVEASSEHKRPYSLSVKISDETATCKMS